MPVPSSENARPPIVTQYYLQGGLSPPRRIVERARGREEGPTTPRPSSCAPRPLAFRAAANSDNVRPLFLFLFFLAVALKGSMQVTTFPVGEDVGRVWACKASVTSTYLYNLINVLFRAGSIKNPEIS